MLGKKLLKEISSPINAKIQVISFLGKPRIFVNNMLQSGGLIESIWKKAIKKLNHQSLIINHCLILGLGGGSAAKLLDRSFPEIRITAIEIDPIMIRLGKKYFDLDKIKNLKIINNDAFQEVEKMYQCIDTLIQKAVKTPRRWPNGLLRGGEKKKNSFDLILVDLYLDNKFPKQAESSSFLKNLKKLLAKNGIIVFNRLFEKKDKKQVEKFIKKLDKYFSKIELERAFSNLLIFCQK